MTKDGGARREEGGCEERRVAEGTIPDRFVAAAVDLLGELPAARRSCSPLGAHRVARLEGMRVPTMQNQCEVDKMFTQTHTHTHSLTHTRQACCLEENTNPRRRYF